MHTSDSEIRWSSKCHLAEAEVAGRKMMKPELSESEICADDFEARFNAQSRGKSGYHRSKSHVDR